MSELGVPGAILNYAVTGTGPLIVLVPGARGSGAVFTPLAQHLAEGSSVLTYDRRGYGGSRHTEEPPDLSHRLRTDADDVARLIAHAGDGPATVFGSSSGAIVALQTAVQHPEAVGRLIAHEPPALTLLLDASRWQGFAQDIHDTYKTAGIQPAMGKFLMSMMSESDRDMLKHVAGRADPALMARDTGYWFEHELRQYPSTVFDMAALRAIAGRTTFIAGEDTAGLPPHRIAVLFAEAIGAPLRVLPGGHIGYLSRAAQFAEALSPLLVRTHLQA